MIMLAEALQDRQDPHSLPMQDRIYQVQVLSDGVWQDYGSLAITSTTAYLLGRQLNNVVTRGTTNTMSFGAGHTGGHKGNFAFTATGSAFVGSLTTPGGELVQARGHLTSVTFTTERSPRGANTYSAFQPLTFGTDWVEGPGGSKVLQIFVQLGDDDVSDRATATAITNGVTSLEMVPSFMGGGDTFDIGIAIDDSSFTGTYTDADGTVYDWRGTATPDSHAKRVAVAANFANLRAEVPVPAAAGAPTDQDRLQELLGVSSIYAVTVKGETKVVDQAQVKTGRYFQDNLINSLDQQWINQFFGSKVPVTPNVQKIHDDHAAFYASTAVMNLGQMFHDAFKDDPNEKAIVARIDNDKLAKAWKDMGTNKDYALQASPLYVEGYRDGVSGIQWFMDNDPKHWARLLHDQLTSDQHLATFSIQAASEQFKNVREQMYEWHTQILALDPDARDAAQDVLVKNFGVVVASQFNQLTWDESMKPYLAEIIDNMLNGDASGFYDDAMRQQQIKQLQETLKEITGTYDNVLKFVDSLYVALETYSKQRKRNLAAAGQDVYHAMANEDPTRWQRFKDAKGPEVIGAIAYGVGAAFLLYSLISGGGEVTTIKDVIVEINIGLLALGALIAGVQKLMATRIGTWFTAAAADGASRMTIALKGFGKWFTEEGTVDNKIAKFFVTDNAAEFMTKRLGPALALAGIALSAWNLADDIMAGDIRDIVFDSLNTAFSVADAVFLGIEIFAAGSGPLAIAVAAVGLIVGLIQFLWDLISPPAPPPDPVEQFVDGPLAQAGFTVAPA